MLERENKNIGFKTETFQSDSDESLEKSSSNKRIIFFLWEKKPCSFQKCKHILLSSATVLQIGDV